MTEREKCLAGEWYDAAGDPELQAIMQRTQELMYDFNHARPSEREKANALLRQALGSVGEGSVVLAPFQCDYGVNIHIGRDCFFNKGCCILDERPVEFGDHVFVGPMCGFHAAIHPTDIARRAAGIERAEPIRVGSHVWIGAQVCVLPGVSIGDCSIVGAGSVVTRDIPPRSVAVGNPCRVIRTLTEEELGEIPDEFGKNEP